MNVHVRVTDSGELQVTSGGVTFPPLPVAAVQAMAAKASEAAQVAAAQTRTAAVRTLTDVLAAPGTSGSVNYAADAVTAEVNDVAYRRAVEAFGVQPGPDGAVRSGPVVVRKRPPPTPTP